MRRLADRTIGTRQTRRSPTHSRHNTKKRTQKKAPAFVMVALVRLLFIGPLNPFADVQRRRKGNAGVIKVQPRARVLAFEYLLIRSQSDYLQH